jgi:hypothetical protein
VIGLFAMTALLAIAVIIAVSGEVTGQTLSWFIGFSMTQGAVGSS